MRDGIWYNKGATQNQIVLAKSMYFFIVKMHALLYYMLLAKWILCSNKWGCVFGVASFEATHFLFRRSFYEEMG